MMLGGITRMVECGALGAMRYPVGGARWDEMLVE